MEEYSVKPYLWELEVSEKDHGAFLDFAVGLPFLKVEKPEGYEQEAVKSSEAAKGSRGRTGIEGGNLREYKKPPYYSHYE